MLLIRDDKAEVPERDRFLKKGMGPDDHIGSPAGDLLQGLPARFSFYRACQQYRPDRKTAFLKISCQRIHVLSGQDLCGRHQGPLSPVFRAEDECQKSQDSLAGAHVSLEQTVHQVSSCQVAPDLPPDLLLFRSK